MSGFRTLFGDEAANTAGALPAALDGWAQAYIGWPMDRDEDGSLATGEFDYFAVDRYDAWHPKSVVFAVDEARDAAIENEDILFNNVGWAGINNVSVIPYLDAAEQHILDFIEYLLSGDFSVAREDLGDEFWEPRLTDLDTTTVAGDAEAGEASGGDPGKPTANAVDTGLEPIYSPQGDNDWAFFSPAATDWVNTTVLDAIRDFIEYFINDADVDAIVAKYRAAITAEYTAEFQRATSITHLAGAANTSPALLSSWRRVEEIERQVAAFRAELLNRMYPDASSIIGIFQTMANDAARIDNTKLQLNAQILQANISRMDAFLEYGVAKASNDTQASINSGQFETQVNIENMARRLEGEIRMIVSALDARTRLAPISDDTKVQIAKMLMALYQNLATMKQQRASVATELRREYQTNKLKMYMWKIQLAETLMNAAIVPLGVPMNPPLPSQFETRVAAGIQTFVNVAGTLAPSGNVPLAVGAGLLGAAATTFLPRTIGD